MDFPFKVNYKNKSDEELVALINKGKEKAFNEIYERYSKRLFLFFYQKLFHDHNKAEDFLQDLFIKLIDKAVTFNQTKKFSSWIYSIAYNMCKNEYRHHAIKNKSITQLSAEQLNSSEVLSTVNESDVYNSFKKSLNNELKKIDEKHSSTFILRHQENMSIKEISLIMDCSEGTVKSRLFYTTKKLSVALRRFNSENF